MLSLSSTSEIKEMRVLSFFRDVEFAQVIISERDQAFSDLLEKAKRSLVDVSKRVLGDQILTRNIFHNVCIYWFRGDLSHIDSELRDLEQKEMKW